MRRAMLLVPLALVVVGCASSRDSTEVATTTSLLAPVQQYHNEPGTGSFTGALADVSEQRCERVGDGWKASGIATNPTADRVDYRVFVSILDASLATLGVGETNVENVAPAAAGKYAAIVRSAATTANCVLRVERRVRG